MKATASGVADHGQSEPGRKAEPRTEDAEVAQAVGLAKNAIAGVDVGHAASDDEACDNPQPDASQRARPPAAKVRAGARRHDHVEVLRQARELRDRGRRVRAVRIADHDVLEPGGKYAATERQTVAKVLRRRHDLRTGLLRRGGRGVGGPVIHQQDLVDKTSSVERRPEGPHNPADGAGFVIRRNDERHAVDHAGTSDSNRADAPTVIERGRSRPRTGRRAGQPGTPGAAAPGPPGDRTGAPGR